MRVPGAVGLMCMFLASCSVALVTPSPATVRSFLEPCDDAIGDGTKQGEQLPAPGSHAYCAVSSLSLPSGWEDTLALILISDRDDDPLVDRLALVYLTGPPGTSTYLPALRGVWPDVDLSRHSLLTWNGATSGDGTGPCGGDDDAFLTEREPENFAARAKEVGESCSQAGFGGAADIGAWVAAEELEAIRLQLGVDRMDMFTQSYGTAVAEAYLYSHPEHVRRAVLDAPVALQAPWPARLAAVAPVLRDGANRLAIACLTEACIGVLGGIPEWRSYLTLRDAVLAEERPVGDSGLSLTPVMVDQATQVALRDPTSIGLWVGAIDAALAGDGGPLWRLGERLYVDLDQQVYYRSLCADIHRPDDERDYAVADDALLFAYSSSLAPCASFPRGVIRPPGPPGDPAPDVLLVASPNDPLAPASLIQADRFLVSLGWTCETDVAGHTGAGDPPIRALVDEFLANGNAEAIAARC